MTGDIKSIYDKAAHVAYGVDYERCSAHVRAELRFIVDCILDEAKAAVVAAIRANNEACRGRIQEAAEAAIDALKDRA